ncbi:hypothetical protein [Hugenholtzia roseola]|uniref:hypothetical protein n=1 Tax=Hugenholtzia roseola TaxID=1002 RepID=UPI0004079790|nr:hypothetical protein [Hugenholtzia roseola]
MSLETEHLLMRKASTLIAFRCLPQEVDMIAIASSSPNYLIEDKILMQGAIPADLRSHFLVKREFLPYVGERDLVIQTLQQDGFLPITAEIFESIVQIWQSYQV